MITVNLAAQLRAAGLAWTPQWGDTFHVPDRELDDRFFLISDMSTDVTHLVDGIAAITFNGSVEWSLDYILSQEVVWMPSESQLRQRVEPVLERLDRNDDGYTCVLRVAGETVEFTAVSAEAAYGLALLQLLKSR